MNVCLGHSVDPQYGGGNNYLQNNVIVTCQFFAKSLEVVKSLKKDSLCVNVVIYLLSLFIDRMTVRHCAV